MMMMMMKIAVYSMFLKALFHSNAQSSNTG